MVGQKSVGGYHTCSEPKIRHGLHGGQGIVLFSNVSSASRYVWMQALRVNIDQCTRLALRASKTVGLPAVPCETPGTICA